MCCIDRLKPQPKADIGFLAEIGLWLGKVERLDARNRHRHFGGIANYVVDWDVTAQLHWTRSAET